MKKEDARFAVLREYDRWAKGHPNDAKNMGGFVFFGYLDKERPDLLDSVPSVANGKPFTTGFVKEVDWKIKAAKSFLITAAAVEATGRLAPDRRQGASDLHQ